MNPEQFSEYVQNNPLMYPPIMEGYYPGAPPQPIPRVEEIHKNTQSLLDEVPTLAPPERVSHRVQKRKLGDASSSQKVQEECRDRSDGDILKKLEEFEVQVKSLQSVAEILWKRLSSEEEERKNVKQVQSQAIIKLRDNILNVHAQFRKGIERLATYSMDTRKKLKTHNKIIDDFQGLVDSYMNNKMEHYLNERCLMKFNEMADKILTETEMTPEEIGEIAKSLGLDDKDPPPSSSDEEPMLVWNLDDVIVLFGCEDR